MPTMGRMGVFGGMALGSAGFVPRRVGAPYFRAQAQATAFALLGDRYHNSDHYRTAFGRTLVEGAGLSIDFSDDYTLVNADHLSRYRMLIIGRDGINWPYGHGNPTSNAGWWAQGQHEIVSDPPLPEIEARSVGWITPEQGQAVKEFVENGGTARFYHNVTNVALYSNDFRDALGAAYQGHPPTRPFKVRILNPDHPITEGVCDLSLPGTSSRRCGTPSTRRSRRTLCASSWRGPEPRRGRSGSLLRRCPGDP